MDNTWEEQRATYIAGEIGGAVLDLILSGVAIGRESILESLESKGRVVGNTMHQGILKDAAQYVRMGK